MHRGRKGGVRERLKRRKNILPLPVIITGNARSLYNKIEELNSRVNHLSEYKFASHIAVTETWFKKKATTESVNPIKDTSVNIDNFRLVRGDRTADSDKTGGGGCEQQVVSPK